MLPLPSLIIANYCFHYPHFAAINIIIIMLITMLIIIMLIIIMLIIIIIIVRDSDLALGVDRLVAGPMLCGYK